MDRDIIKENELLLERLRHLLESDIISEYDEINLNTGNYKKDIKELDRMFKKFTEVNLTKAPKPEPPKNQYGKVMADKIITGTTPIITIDSKGVRLAYNSIDDVPDDMLMSILKERQAKKGNAISKENEADNPPKGGSSIKKEPLVVNVNINGLDELKELIEQWNPFNYKNIGCDFGKDKDRTNIAYSMTSEEQDIVIFNLLYDRYRWLKEESRTRDEDENKYRKQIEYLYNLYKNKIK